MHASPASCAVSSNLVVMLLALPIGFLIGLIGIGGVLLVPLLTIVGGCGQQAAITMSLASFIALGAASVFTRMREAGPPKRADWLLFIAMIPGAVAGALLLYHVPETLLALLIATAVAFSGGWALRGDARSTRPDTALGPGALLAIGGITGGASALSGTGGPLVLMPLLLAAGMAVADAIGFARIAQFPIALSATLTRSAGTRLDVAAVAALSAVLLVGMLAGARMVNVVQSRVLLRSVGWALLITGCGLGLLAGVRAFR
jgi:uncharacterized membrane protein YfcA